MTETLAFVLQVWALIGALVFVITLFNNPTYNNKLVVFVLFVLAWPFLLWGGIRKAFEDEAEKD